MFLFYLLRTERCLVSFECNIIMGKEPFFSSLISEHTVSIRWCSRQKIWCYLWKYSVLDFTIITDVKLNGSNFRFLISSSNLSTEPLWHSSDMLIPIPRLLCLRNSSVDWILLVRFDFLVPVWLCLHLISLCHTEKNVCREKHFLCWSVPPMHECAFFLSAVDYNSKTE